MPIMLCDSNYLGKPQLLDYLGASHKNIIAVPENVLVEQFKEFAVDNVRRSFEQARRFPKQIVILKSVVPFYQRRIKNKACAMELVDKEQTQGFPGWYDDLLKIDELPNLQKHMAERQAESSAEHESLRQQTIHLVPILKLMKKDFRPDELKEIRSGRLERETTQKKLFDAIHAITIALLNRLKVPQDRRPRNLEDAAHFYLFRYAICLVHLFVKWVDWGNLSSDEDAQVNHIVDMMITAQATFFNGVLSDDKMVRFAFPNARMLIKELQGYVPH